MTAPENFKKIKLAIVVSHPIQHFCPLYSELAKTMCVKVFFACSFGVKKAYDKGFGRETFLGKRFLDGYDHVFLSDDTTFDKRVFPRLRECLSEYKPDAIQTYGAYSALSRAAIKWARKRKIFTLAIADSERRQKGNALKEALFYLPKKRLLDKVGGFLVVGDENRMYYRFYGVSEQKLFFSPFTIDEQLYEKFWGEKQSWRSKLRGELGINENDIVFLNVGKFTMRKRQEDLIRAVQGLRRETREKVKVLLVGDGPEKARCENLVKDLGLIPIVIFGGYVGVEELPAYYCCSDVIVCSSIFDHHPLVVVEATYLGLPTIVSNAVGCVGPSDTVRLGNNGLEYPASDINALSARMQRFGESRTLIQEMGLAARAVGLEMNMQASIRGYLRALTEVSLVGKQPEKEG